MWALVPFKILSDAKRRLAPALAPDERAALSLAMLHDVLDALRDVPPLAGIALATNDPVAAAFAGRLGIEVIAYDAGTADLNAAVGTAIRMLRARAIEEILVLHADLPLATAAAVDGVIAAHRQMAARPRLTLVPDRSGTGTNALLATPGDAVPCCFGRASRSRFERAAEQRRVTVQVTEPPALTFDIDTPADLQMLRQSLCECPARSASHTRQVLSTLASPAAACADPSSSVPA